MLRCLVDGDVHPQNPATGDEDPQTEWVTLSNKPNASES